MWDWIKREAKERLAYWENIVWIGVTMACLFIGYEALTHVNFVLIYGTAAACGAGALFALYKMFYNPIKEAIIEEELIIKRKLALAAKKMLETPEEATDATTPTTQQ